MSRYLVRAKLGRCQAPRGSTGPGGTSSPALPGLANPLLLLRPNPPPVPRTVPWGSCPEATFQPPEAGLPHSGALPGWRQAPPALPSRIPPPFRRQGRAPPTQHPGFQPPLGCAPHPTGPFPQGRAGWLQLGLRAAGPLGSERQRKIKKERVTLWSALRAGWGRGGKTGRSPRPPALGKDTDHRPLRVPSESSKASWRPQTSAPGRGKSRPR